MAQMKPFKYALFFIFSFAGNTHYLSTNVCTLSYCLSEAFAKLNVENIASLKKTNCCGTRQ